MKTIKIIDLLNKISRGEEVPKKIKYNHTEYIYREITKQYYIKGCMGTYDSSLRYELTSFNRLNDEVEIIEEEKKIPEKSNIDFNTKLPVSGCSENEAFMMTCISHLGNTMDKIIDYLESKGDE